MSPRGKASDHTLMYLRVIQPHNVRYAMLYSDRRMSLIRWTPRVTSGLAGTCPGKFLGRGHA